MNAFKPRPALPRGGGGLSGMTPNPNPVGDPVRVAVSPALGAGGGASGTAPEVLARELVYKTPSEFDSILIVAPSGIQYASKGRYGGWIVRGQLAGSDTIVALWCYEREWSSAGDAHNVEDPNVKRFLDELAKHGFDFSLASHVPKARVILYKYKPVEVRVKKATDRYTVIDITPVGVDTAIEAKAIHLYWFYHVSRKGHCSGFCSETAREKVRLVAKMLGLEVYSADAEYGSRNYEIRAKFVTDYVQVADYLRSRLTSAPEPAEVAPATAEAGLPPLPELPGEAAEVEVGGGVAVATAMTPPGYVKVKVVDFDLPTEYIGGKTTTVLEEVEEGEGKRAVTVEKKEVKIPELRTLRRMFYNVLKRIAFKASGLWVLVHDVTEDELRELNGVMAEINSILAKHGIPARSIGIIEAYLPEQWVKVKLAEYIDHVMSELEARKAAEKKTREVLREIKRLEALLKRLMKEQKLYPVPVTLQERAEVA
jgi:hypothetical protein